MNHAHAIRPHGLPVCRALVLTAAVLAALCSSAPAQNYSFQVPEMELHVTVNPDASITMEYKITFLCNEGADPVDIVDVGVPTYDYDIENMSARLNGEELPTIRSSEYVHPGVEVPLSPAVGPGKTGVFEMKFTMPDMVYQDTTRADYASLRITPTWFDGDFMTGTTKLGIIVYLPDSLQLDDVLHQGENFTQKFDLDDKKAVAWVYEDTRVDGPHMVAVSFPKTEMERVVHMTRLGLLWKWWSGSAVARVTAGIIFLIAFGIFYYRLTGGTGSCLFIILLIVLIVLWVDPYLEAAFPLVLIPGWYLSEKVMARKKRDYLPAIESVPGGGIKRGLAVPEAAVLLEQPLGRVLTMVIFGMLKKNLLSMVDPDPLTVEIAEGYDTNRSQRRKVAKEQGTVIRGYEQPFLDEIAKSPRKPVAQLDLRKAMKELVNTTAKRVNGFDFEQTKEYYLSIVNKAWQQAKEIGEIEQRTEFVDDNLLWLMLADNYHDEFHTWHRSGYDYHPTWGGPGGTAPAPRVAVPGGRTTISDVAASFAGWSENVTGKLAGGMDPVNVGIMRGGGINLSGMDKVSMDVLDALASSSSSGGHGGGGGCACACAGCACACACAGGGR